MRRVHVLFGLISTLGACSSFGTDADPPKEASDAGDAGPVVGGDASLSATDADAGFVPVPCPTAFCANFETGDVADGWTKMTDGPSPVIAIGQGHESPRGFHAEVGNVTGNVGRVAQLTRTFKNVTALTCSFWVRVLSANPDSDYLQVTYSGKLGKQAIWIDSDKGFTRSNPSLAVLADINTTWTKVKFVIDETTFHLSYDEKDQATENLQIAGPWEIGIGIGISTSEPEGTAIEFDDIECDHP